MTSEMMQKIRWKCHVGICWSCFACPTWIETSKPQKKIVHLHRIGCPRVPQCAANICSAASFAGGKKEPEDATLNKYSLEAYVKTMGPWAIYTILYPY